MALEIWKDIKGFEGKYQVSNLGRIRLFLVRMLKPQTDKAGYSALTLRDFKQKHKRVLVHRAVAKAFIKQHDKNLVVNHINCIRNDNRVENLEWVTRQQNQDHAVKLGRIRKGENSPSAKLTEKQAREIKASKLRGTELGLIYSIHSSTAQKIKNGKLWKHLSIIILLATVINSQAQTVLLPTWVADSLIYETKKGRQCANVIKAQANEIEKLGAELMHTNKALDLKQSETQTLESLLSNSKEQGRVDKMQADLDKSVLKKKVRRRNLLILGESVVIVLLLAL